ncbi:Diaminopimelate decarboxylase [Symmachiella dynata]|uniref:Diaminopimelate decarboxylase n=1 Tax=Symmachiella dynata TaxID=2527995 RepID=A0A517ZLE1_9PLAN|nr:diaminopimelate decarboxylase [Symmachiella dynata]QDU43288.1 Diaminopimelate decarboxylase [Symmachiella dynata]
MDHFEYRDGELFCEEVRIADLAAEFGTPLWVYSQNALLSNLREIQIAFADAEPVICYSVKANSNLSILKLMNEAGSSFDVVSGGELYRVQQAGGDTTRVAFAGVGKTDAEIRFGLESNILMFNVESEAELDAIAAVAGDMGVVAPVALRLNPNIDAKTHAKTTTGKKGNKFGIDIERASELAAKVLADGRLSLVGIHMHLGSPILTTEPYAMAVKKGVEIVNEFRAAGHDTNWINLGGGFGINYKQNEAPPAKAFADVIVPAIREAGCRLALEPGRFICGNAGVLISSVTFTKREGGKLFVIQDAAMNDLVRPAMYDAFHRIWPVKPAVEAPDDYEGEIPGCEPVDVVGPVCESGDVLAKARWLPETSRGDLICTFSAGAYGTTMSSNYNSRPRGAEVMVSGGTHRIIRRRETYEDLVANEMIES